MNVEVRPRLAVPAGTRLAIADCDIHPAQRTPNDLDPWLPKRWRDHAAQFGGVAAAGHAARARPIPKSQPDASRRDALPPEGGRQGSSLSFMAAQHLDPNNVVLGILNPLNSGQGVANPELSAALCRAVNHWQEEVWLTDDRLRASIVVPYEHADLAAAEIEFWAGRRGFVAGAAAVADGGAAGQPTILEDVSRGGGGRPARSRCMRSGMADRRSRARAGRRTTSRR